MLLNVSDTALKLCRSEADDIHAHSWILAFSASQAFAFLTSLVEPALRPQLTRHVHRESDAIAVTASKKK